MHLGFDTLWGRREVSKFLKWETNGTTLHEKMFEALLSHPEMAKMVTDMRVSLSQRLAWKSCVRDYLIGESVSRDWTSGL